MQKRRRKENDQSASSMNAGRTKSSGAWCVRKSRQHVSGVMGRLAVAPPEQLAVAPPELLTDEIRSFKHSWVTKSPHPWRHAYLPVITSNPRRGPRKNHKTKGSNLGLFHLGCPGWALSKCLLSSASRHLGWTCSWSELGWTCSWSKSESGRSMRTAK